MYTRNGKIEERERERGRMEVVEFKLEFTGGVSVARGRLIFSLFDCCMYMYAAGDNESEF